jgi:pimeloyl-ACP methyl ester carboxylesterase
MSMLISAAKYIARIAPDPLATSLTTALAALTPRAPVSSIEQAALAQATRLTYGAQADHVAWAWGDGPLVVFVHGWGGRAAQLAPLALQISKLGFRCVALDVTGHGASPKRHTRWSYFMRDVAELSRSLSGEIYAYVGHSAGALSMMAARSLQGIHAQRYVCICAPSHPFPPINVIKKRLDPRSSVIEGYKNFIARQFQTSWEGLERGEAFANAGRDLLLFYDQADRFVTHDEGDKLLALCPGARLLKTNGYGHQRVLGAPELAQAVSEFLQDRTRATALGNRL